MTKVLIVEDDPLISFGLTDEIEAAGHRVVGPAPSTGAALMQVRLEKPAVALIDLDLEHVDDSLDLARLLKEMSIPSIVISAAGSAAAIDETVRVKLCATGYLLTRTAAFV